jgi:hypothetical protein
VYVDTQEITVVKQEQLEKSRLGRLLVNRGVISEFQLDQALIIQAATKTRLGEVLVQKGWVTNSDVEAVLRQQHRTRRLAAFMTLIVTPFVSLPSLATTAVSVPGVKPRPIQENIDAMMPQLGGLQMMSEEEMEGVSAQGLFSPRSNLGLQTNDDGIGAGLFNKYNDDEDDDYQQDEEQIAYELADTVLTMAGLGPISSLIDADVTIEGLRYHEGQSQIEITADGAMKFYMPEGIDKVSMENIRVAGSDDPAIFGHIFMTDIKWAAGSNYTIRARD